MRLIFDQTVGYQRDWAELAVGWFAWMIQVTPRAILSSLEALKKSGLILIHRAGQLNEYSIDMEWLARARPYERPAPRPSPSKPAKLSPIPVIPIRLKKISYMGRLLTPPGGADILTTDVETSAVAKCLSCQTVDIFPLIPCSHLEISDGEETAKDEPEFTIGEQKERKMNHSSPLGKKRRTN